jgi:hypothetical protein
MEEADGLAAASSSEFAAIDGDVGVEIGQKLVCVIVNLLEREVNSAGYVRLGEGYCGEHVEDGELRIVQAAMEFVAGDFGVRRIRNRFDLRSHDLRQRLIHRTAGGK